MAKQKQPRARVAIVDDEHVILEAWKEILEERYELRLFSDPFAAQRHFSDEEVDVALLDMRMPGMDGMTLLQHLKSVQPRAESIVVTGHGTVEMAVQAIQQGAYDFLCKPVDDLESAIRRIDTAVDRKRLCELNAQLQGQVEAFGPGTELIGESRALREVRSLIEQVAQSGAPVLISGESGTGKELAARALHSRSARKDSPFVAVNCAAISETLIGSELFGHEKGAFTGAVSHHKGLFEAANGGVLFLDEIGDVPLQIQVQLLRALQEGEIRPVGANRSRKVDVRVVAATNVDLEKAMREGHFREDLYYRISTFRLAIPPLRERQSDIPPIAQHLLENLSQRDSSASGVKGFSDDALKALVSYDWPGNVRELNNAIEHAVTLCQSDTVQLSQLPPFVTANKGAGRSGSQRHAGGVAGVSSTPFSTARAELLKTFEERYLKDLLATTEGNLSEASRRSGIDRSNLRRLLRRHHMKAAEFRGSGSQSSAGHSPSVGLAVADAKSTPASSALTSDAGH